MLFRSKTFTRFQQLGKSITSEVSGPVGVAFDSKGNVYVANQGSNTVTQYSPAGVLNTRFSISGIASPLAIAVDGVDDLYVLNADPESDVMVFPLADTVNGPFLLTTIRPASPNPLAISGSSASNASWKETRWFSKATRRWLEMATRWV